MEHSVYFSKCQATPLMTLLTKYGCFGLTSAVHQTSSPAHLLGALEAKGWFSDVSAETLPNPDLAFKMANLPIHQSEAAASEDQATSPDNPPSSTLKVMKCFRISPPESFLHRVVNVQERCKHFFDDLHDRCSFILLFAAAAFIVSSVTSADLSPPDPGALLFLINAPTAFLLVFTSLLRTKRCFLWHGKT